MRLEMLAADKMLIRRRRKWNLGGNFSAAAAADPVLHEPPSVDVTPIRNWCSSTRLKTFPHSLRGVDDSVGYDFQLQDTRELFVRGSGRRTKRCYFEVEGTSGSFDPQRTRFHISENELSMCRSIAYDERRLEREAYLIVIVQHCLDLEKISLGTIIDWYECWYLSMNISSDLVAVF
jgi:hypothetical protein